MRSGKPTRYRLPLYMHGACVEVYRLLFKFRSGTHGLNEEFGRHKVWEGRNECLLCDNECESVSGFCGCV